MTTNDATPKAGQKQATRRAIGYVRVSDVGGRGGESFISPDVQRATIETLAAAKGYRVVEWREDLDEVGSHLERPELEAAFETIERGGAEALIVWKQSRFSRSMLDTATAIARLAEAGAVLVAGDLPDVDDHGFGKVMRMLVAGMAEVELDGIRENWRAAQASAVGRGVAIKSRAPFGYRFKSDDDHRLVPVAGEALAVVELFERRVAGAGLGELVRFFEEATGLKRSRTTIKQMLANESYVGVIAFGELRNEDAHTAIVERELFDAAQAFQAATTSAHVLGRRVNHGKAKSLLAGIARCATCGRSLACIPNGKNRTMTYRCPSETSRCSAKGSILAADLDAFVEATVLEWAGPVLDVEVELELEMSGVGDRVVVEHRLAEARTLLVDYVSSPVVQTLGLELFEAGVQARQEAIAELELELEALGQASAADVARTTLRSSWPELETSERRRLLAVVLDRVDVIRTPRRGAPAAERAVVLFRGTPERVEEPVPAATVDAAELLEESIA